MTPKQMILDMHQHKDTPKIPWVPFAGVHAGKLVGYTADEVLRNGDKLTEALLAVNRLYKPFGQPIMFDLQIEAECLGCELRWATDAPPSVASHPLEENPVVPCKCTIPTKEDGRIPLVLDVMGRMKEAVGDTTALYGLICGPFTLASHLRGNDIFMDMYDDEDFMNDLMQYCTDVACAMADYYVEAGMDIIAVVDPLISQISTTHFQEFMTDKFKALFDHIRGLGVFSSFFVCGDATRNVRNMCETGPDAISVDENVNLIEAKAITDEYNIVIGGNIPLTTVMLHGTQQDNMKFALELIDSLPNTHNFILAPGCDMPYDVPVENTIGVAQAVWEPDAVRGMLENYVAVEEDIIVDIPDYKALAKPLVEVFTLDSATCAACTYMMGAANAAKEAFGDAIDMVEYKFTVKENIARCKAMGVQNLPSMYINGELRFRSIIPSKEELDGAIRQAIDAIGGALQ